MTPTPDRDVVIDLAVAGVDETTTVRADYSWNLDGDVLRDLLLRAG